MTSDVATMLPKFKKIRLTDEYWTEAPAIGDINRDGHADIVAGPYWYQGPDFSIRHEIYPPTQAFTVRHPDGRIESLAGFEGAKGSGKPTIETESIFTKIVDLTNNGWPDIIMIGHMPGSYARAVPSRTLQWFENPGEGLNWGKPWIRHIISEDIDNSSVDFVDLFDNGKLVLLCMHRGHAGYFKPHATDPRRPWSFHAVSRHDPEFTWFAHGLGCGDLTGNGRKDILHADGWWEHPEAGGEDGGIWEYHPFPFNLGPNQIKQSWYSNTTAPFKTPVLYEMGADGVPLILTVFGGSQLCVCDINGDGRADVVTSLAAHGHGLVWWEQLEKRRGLNGRHRLSDNNGIDFRRHMIMGANAADIQSGVVFSELQAIAVADLDGDGLLDIITGKRFWSHGDGQDAIFDPDPNGAAVLYWFKQSRNAANEVEFAPYLIDAMSGAGTQIAVGDVTGAGRLDIVVANKNGAFLFVRDEEVTE